jgi:hypothetical protein
MALSNYNLNKYDELYIVIGYTRVSLLGEYFVRNYTSSFQAF